MKNKKFCIFLIALCFLIFLLSYFVYKNSFNELRDIKARGVLIVGTTGDYCPMSCYDSETKKYTGFDISMAEDLAESLGVKIEYKRTTWQTLVQDTIDKKFDIAVSGITITNERKSNALMSDGYLENGKTILCRKEDVKKYINMDTLNNPKVRIMENPGGLNEKFVRENLPKAELIIHDINYEIPQLVAEGKADVMITEIVEAKYYSNINKKLAAPLVQNPFTKGQIGMLMPGQSKTLHRYVNKFIKNEQNSGRIYELKEKFNLCVL